MEKLMEYGISSWLPGLYIFFYFWKFNCVKSLIKSRIQERLYIYRNEVFSFFLFSFLFRKILFRPCFHYYYYYFLQFCFTYTFVCLTVQKIQFPGSRKFLVHPWHKHKLTLFYQSSAEIRWTIHVQIDAA